MDDDVGLLEPGSTAPQENTGAPSADAPSLRSARLIVLTAAIMWSTSGFFVKAPYLAGWSGPSVAFWRATFACIALWPLVHNPRWTWRLVPMMLFFVGMNYTYLTAMVEGNAANAIWLQCTAPVWILLVGVFVYGEESTWRDWLMVASSMIGVGAILYNESHGIGQAAVAWGLASSFFYAGVVLSLRQLRGYNPIWLAALNHSVTALALAPFAVASSHFPNGMQWIFLAGLGIFQMAAPYALFAHALKRIAGHEATAIGLIEPLLLPVWAYLAWGDRPSQWTLIGGAFILIGLACRFIVPENWRLKQA